MARGLTRGLPSDANFSDEVVESFGAPILSGGGYSDNAIIAAGGAISPVTTTKSGERVSDQGFIDEAGDIIPIKELSEPIPRPKPPIRVVSGCTDRTAINYNPLATINKQSTCRYPTPPSKPLSESRSISVSVTSTNGGSIILNGKDTLNQPTKVYQFTGKELLQPQIFKVVKDGFVSNEEYKLYAVEKVLTKTVTPLVIADDDFIDFDDVVIEDRIPIRGNGLISNFGIEDRGYGGIEFNDNLGRGTGGFAAANLGYTTPVRRKGPRKPRPVSTIQYSYYEFKLEKNGEFVDVPNQINNITETINKSQFVNLKFNLESVKIVEDPAPDVPIKLNVESFVSSDDIIKYETSWGKSGYLLDEDDIDLTYTPTVNGEKSSISFTSVGISDFTHTVTYEYNTPDQRSNKKITSGGFDLDLSSGQTNIIVNASKMPREASPLAPSVKASIKNFKLNISNPSSIKIPYSSVNSEEVIYTLGKTKRKIDLNGSLVLSKSDFSNGVGNYIIYLQGISKAAGSSSIEKISVTVESKAFIPGPDITNINYPQNIVGADFKGYNVPFDISWQSINTNYVQVYAGKVTSSTSLGKIPGAGLTSFNVGDVLKKLSSANIKPTEVNGVIQFDLLLIPYNSEGDAVTAGKTEQISISFDAGDLTLRRGQVISDIKKAFIENFDKSVFQDSISPFLTHYLHLGEGVNKLVATWGIDTETLSTFEDDLTNNTRVKVNEEKSLILKLYEPLPQNINPNDRIWLSKLQAVPLIDQITIIDDISKNCTPLTPNFALEVNDVIGYQILDDLISSGSQSSSDVVNQFVSSSEFSLENLNISYVTASTSLVETTGTGTFFQTSGTPSINWDAFVKYSSAEERTENFIYKVKLIQSYETRYNGLVSGSSIDFGGGTGTISGAASSSVAVRNEANRTLSKINDTKKGFDAFEKLLYTSSSLSGITWPGAGGSALSASTDSSVTTWYNTTILSAKSYDETNTSRLVSNLPSHIQNDQEGQSFTLFFDMIGQHFDILWTHIDGINKNKKLEHKFENGINDKVIYHMLESLGWDADMGAQSQLLWEYAFGKHSDGTSVSTMSGKDRQNEVWRRLLNNLPYLQKHKGTRRAISAALSCYGIPNSLLTIMEFGGPQNANKDATTTFTFEDRTSSLNISGASSIIVPWKSHNGKYPNSVEVRVNTDQKQDQNIISGSGWHLDIDYPESGSLGKLTFNILSGSEFISSSTEKVAFFNDEYSQLVVNRTTGSSVGVDDTIDVYLKEGFQGRIRNTISTTIKVPSGSNGWGSGQELKIGGSTLTGSIDEFRLWAAPLSESVINNHTLMPEAINGNHVSSSTEDLMFRLDFEHPKNRHSSGDPFIKNVSVNRTYDTFATASNLPSISDYPHQYKIYDRDVTAEVPSTGISFGNKVRFETQTKVTDLSYRSRATKKSFDQSPLDSDKLGLFFSPIKEINLDIMKSLGSFNIDNYIGDPSDDFKSEYKDLASLRNYYFDRYNLNLSEYIQLVRYIDKSLFDVLESLVPARAKVSSGLLIEPHILERSKVEKRPTIASSHQHDSSIDTQEDISVNSTNDGKVGILTASQHTVLSSTKNDYSGFISSSISPNLVSSKNSYNSTINAENDINQFGFITVNSGSNMGGISIVIDAEFSSSAQGEFTSDIFEQVGNNPESLTVAGFGLYAENGHSIITRLDKNNNFIKERKRVDIITETFSVDVPENIDSNDSSKGRHFVATTVTRKRVNFRNFADSGSLLAGNVTKVEPLDGYVPYHYRNVGDITTGLENSFSLGSKQTSLTTLDGGSPVQTFTTNPNTLRVSDSGRGSGEPILEVD